jgi:16S rRNA (guanine1207-N2)-methyltransferase
MTHYYDETQNAPSHEQEVSFTVRGRAFRAVTDAGVFSKDGLDAATRLLLESCEGIAEGSRVLDLGCGWGPVGLVLKSVFPSIILTMTDVNTRALELSRKNLKRAHLDGTVIQSDGFATLDGEFDVILSNPPMAAGRETCYRMLSESYTHLATSGSLYVVARHQKGGAMLEKHLEGLAGSVETLAKGGGFRVYKATKR